MRKQFKKRANRGDEEVTERTMMPSISEKKR